MLLKFFRHVTEVFVVVGLSLVLSDGWPTCPSRCRLKCWSIGLTRLCLHLEWRLATRIFFLATLNLVLLFGDRSAQLGLLGLPRRLAFIMGKYGRLV